MKGTNPSAAGTAERRLGRLRWFLGLLTAAAFLAAARPASADSFTISDWYNAVMVDGPNGRQDDFWTAIENPCLRTLSAQVGSSTSNTNLDYAWASQFGQFLVQSTQVAVGSAGGSLLSYSGSTISITPSVDLSLWVHGSYSYSLHGPMESALDVWVMDSVSHTNLFTRYQWYDTVLGPPYSGTFYVNSHITMPAGTTWVLGYSMETRAWTGSTGLTGTGSGSLTWEITPEPAALALLTLPLLALTRRPRLRLTAKSQ
jgi:hypothetical protein